MIGARLCLGCRTLLLAFAICLGSWINVADAHAPFSVGDSVTVIKDTTLKSQNRVVGTVAAGTTVKVKKIDGSLLLLDDTDIRGWIPETNVIAFEEAASYFTGLVEQSPKDPSNYYFRAGVWQTQEKFDLAVQDYDAAIRLNPKEAAFYTERGVCFLATKEFSRAIADFTEAIRLQPRTIGPYVGRGGAFCETGEYQKAFADWKTAVRLDPKFIMPRACIVELLACCPDAKFRRGKEAVQFATDLCQETEWQDSQMLHYLACAYAECADFESAIKWERQAIALNPPERSGYLENFQKALAVFESQKPLHEFMPFVK